MSGPILSRPTTFPGRGAGRMPAFDPLPRGVLVLLGGATTVITVAGIQAFSSVIAPVLLALMLTIAVHPVTEQLRRRGAPGWLAGLAGLVAVYLIVLGIAGAIAVSVARLAMLLPGYAEQFDELVTDMQHLLAQVGVDQEQVDAAVSSIDLGRLASLLQNLVASMSGALSGLIFLVTVLLFMGMDAGKFSDRLTEVTTPRSSIVEALRGFAQGTRRYLVVTTVFGLIVAVIDTVALWWLAVPLPITWGLLSFITNYIPNIGFVIGVIPPALLGLLEGGPSLMLQVIVAYSVINVIIQSVIQPKVIGDSVGLSTTMTFLSLVFWAWVLGPLGALLAVPLSLLAKGLLVDIDPNTRWLSPLLSGNPEPVPEPVPEAAGPADDAQPSHAAPPPKEGP